MTKRSGVTGGQPGAFLEQIDLPLRGLASEGANEIVGRALRDLPGVATVTVRAAEQIVHVTYDAAAVSAEAIRGRMHAAGLVHPARDGDAHGPEAPIAERLAGGEVPR